MNVKLKVYDINWISILKYLRFLSGRGRILNLLFTIIGFSCVCVAVLFETKHPLLNSKFWDCDYHYNIARVNIHDTEESYRLLFCFFLFWSALILWCWFFFSVFFILLFIASLEFCNRTYPTIILYMCVALLINNYYV